MGIVLPRFKIEIQFPCTLTGVAFEKIWNLCTCKSKKSQICSTSGLNLLKLNSWNLDFFFKFYFFKTLVSKINSTKSVVMSNSFFKKSQYELLVIILPASLNTNPFFRFKILNLCFRSIPGAKCRKRRQWCQRHVETNVQT